MLITIVDVETTGLNPDTDQVIEVGAVLYSVTHQEIVQQVSTLISVDNNPALHINGIDPNLTQWVGNFAQKTAIDMIKLFYAESDYLVAFNSPFDRQFFAGIPLPDWRDEKRWADAADIKYPKSSNSRSLIALCVAHGIPVVSAHRALDDCRLTAALLGTVPNLEDELIKAARPKVRVQAFVDYNERQLAKDHRFHWDGGQKMWMRWMPAEDIASLPFDAEVVDEW